VDVWAEHFQGRHGCFAADLIWKPKANNLWQHVPMRLDTNDRGRRHQCRRAPADTSIAIEAWTDVFGTWRRDLPGKEKPAATCRSSSKKDGKS